MGFDTMITTKEMQLVPIEKLIPYINNARTHSPEQIAKLRASLREFGFINPVIIDKDYTIIAGHGRCAAAKEEGLTEVPCVLADHLTDAQKKAYIIADNRMAMDAGWDEELLRVEIEALEAEDFDPLLTGFDEDELSKLFDDGNDTKDDDFDVDAELEKPAFTKPGDVWTLGRHRLVCGDSTDPATFDTLMDGKKANLVITDPPYNVNYEGSAGKIKNDEAFWAFLWKVAENTFRKFIKQKERRQSLSPLPDDDTFIDAGASLEEELIESERKNENCAALPRPPSESEGTHTAVRRSAINILE